MADASKQIVKGYQLNERLGEGGAGVVYRATQLSVGREVAIKAILPVHANSREFIRRFEREAQLVARLEHPHIVPLFDYWREPSEAYLVMRYLRAGNLRERMNQKRLSNDEILSIVENIASALDLAHRSGVIHRDIKPENILLDADQNAYLTDFGIAEETNTSQIATVTGSPGYMAPEQIKAARPSPRVDIYALGIMLYEMLAGKHPYPAQTVREMFNSHLNTPLPTLGGFSAALNSVLLRAASKDPASRHPNAMQLFVDFRAAVTGQRVSLNDIEAKSVIVNPYKGLRAFTEADAAVFFGRERLVMQLIARLQEDHPLRNFLAVVGPSGSGKSSVVSAGLVPALRRGVTPEPEPAHKNSMGDLTVTWQPVPLAKTSVRAARELVLQIVPGSHPLESLQAGLLSIASQPLGDIMSQFASDPGSLLKALREIGGTTLLVIDQFEEVFTLTESEQERLQFLDLLRTAVTAADSPLRLIITLRADFTDRPLHYVEFGALMRQRTEFVLPLSPGELERGIAVAPGGHRHAGLRSTVSVRTARVG